MNENNSIIKSLSKPEVIITHESDLDGFVAGLLLQRLAQKLYGEKIPLQAYHYNFWKQRDLRERAAVKIILQLGSAVLRVRRTVGRLPGLMIEGLPL